MAADPKILQALHQLPLFAGLTADLRMQLAPFGALRKIRRGETLYCQTEPSPYCYGILSGEVTLHTSQTNPSTRHSKVLHPGDVLAAFSLLAEGPRQATASVTQDGELLSLWSSRFRAWVETQRSVEGDPAIVSALRQIIPAP